MSLGKALGWRANKEAGGQFRGVWGEMKTKSQHPQVPFLCIHFFFFFFQCEGPCSHIRNIMNRNFPDGPVAKTPNFQCRGPGVPSLARELDLECHN